MLRNTENNQTTLKLYDVDGALFHKSHYDSIEKWLIKENKRLLKHEVSQHQSPGDIKSIIAFGTNRQSFSVDDTNKCRSGSCAPVLPILQSYLAHNSAGEVVLDPFLMADIFDTDKNTKAGDSYIAILNERYAKIRKKKHADWVFDETKITLIYAHAHRVSVLNKESGGIIIDFYDDQDRILTNLRCFFGGNSDLLPENTTLRLHHYSKDSLILDKKGIAGSGVVDSHYDWSVRYLATKACFGGNDKMKSAKTLKHFHKNNDYDAAIITYKNFDSFNAVRFKKFREKHISKLNSDGVSHTANYTTAAELNEKGLIPEKFCIMRRQRNRFMRFFRSEKRLAVSIPDHKESMNLNL